MDSVILYFSFSWWLVNSFTATYDAKESANISTIFDIGGIFGAIAAGMLSDYSGMSALTCAAMLALAVPTVSSQEKHDIKKFKPNRWNLNVFSIPTFQLFIYDYLGTVSFGVNVLLLLTAGFLVNGPYALITTAVSAELGTHPSLGNNAKALATVTSIIDGTGSVGAAIGPLLAGLVSSYYGWHNVFYMLMAADVLALCVSIDITLFHVQIKIISVISMFVDLVFFQLLSRLVYRDMKMFVQRRWSV